jgi:hypothetical protein
MPASIHMKNGDWFRVDAYRDDIEAAMRDQYKKRDADPFRTYDRLDAGIPLPKVTVDVRDISYVNEYRR